MKFEQKARRVLQHGRCLKSKKETNNCTISISSHASGLPRRLQGQKKFKELADFRWSYMLRGRSLTKLTPNLDRSSLVWDKGKARVSINRIQPRKRPVSKGATTVTNVVLTPGKVGKEREKDKQEQNPVCFSYYKGNAETEKKIIE